MNDTQFSGQDYVLSVARHLVAEFTEAGKAGHPVLIGAARETPARAKFVKLLPGNIGVGSGIVIDSFGGRSKQQDIVLFERDICPVFSINDTPEATFFPIESVLAVGEVKSTLDKATLEDCFSKIASVKTLKRFEEEETHIDGLPPAVSYRHYGSRMGMAAVLEDQFSPLNSLDQVFGFVLAGKFGLQSRTIFDHTIANARAYSASSAPNTIISLADGHISWLDAGKNALCRSAMEGETIVFSSQADLAFPWLINLLKLYIDHGRTVAVKHLRRYTNDTDGAGHPITFAEAVVR